MTTEQANKMLDEVERQLGEEFCRRFCFWLQTEDGSDGVRRVTAVQMRDRGNGWLVATFPVSEATTAQELFDAIQRFRLTR
jgi:hypothetical protein